MMDFQSKWFKAYCDQIHKAKIHRIKAEHSKRIDNSIPESISLLKLREQASLSHRANNFYSIYQKNQAILNKITEISKRPSYLLQILKNPGPKTLNFAKRKLAQQQINEENEKFVKRIKDKVSSLSCKSLKKQYENIEQIKKNLGRKHHWFSMNSRSERQFINLGGLSLSKRVESENMNEEI